MPGTATSVKRALIGRPRASRDVQQQLLPRWLALPLFAADPLSSVSYATQEMMVVLAVAGTGALVLTTPLSAAVALLLVVVVITSAQTVRAFPHGGSAYRVTRAQLGDRAGLLAAAALLVDVALTAAVSVTAAATALASAFPAVGDARLGLALGLLALVALANLRGVREVGALIAVPTYLFLVVMLVLLVVGGLRCGLGAGGCPTAASAGVTPPAEQALTAMVVLRAFASGSVMLTGIHRSAGGVPAFRYPQVAEARWTLAVTGALAVVLFLGVGALAQATGAGAGAGAERTVLASVAAAVLGEGAPLAVVQLATAGVLVLAASTAVADFPRLSSVLARDSWLPRHMTARGDRMVFADGIAVLIVAAAGLVVVAGARVSALVPSYLVAVFIALACSQAGMARYWWRRRETRWRRGSALNAAGAAGTALVAVVALVTGLGAGTWAVLVVLVAAMAGMTAVRRHYHDVGSRLVHGIAEREEPRSHEAVIVLDRIDEPAARALSWVLATHPRSVTALGMPIAGADLATRWARLSGGLPMTLVTEADDRHATDKLTAAVAAGRQPGRPTTVVLAEELARSWVDQLRRHRLDLRLKDELRGLDGVAVADVTSPSGGPGPYTVEEPGEHHVLVLTSSVHSGVHTALGYAKLLRPTSLRALSISVDPHASARLLADWEAWGLTTPLEIVDSPFRSLADGVRQAVRRFAPDGRHTVVSCVLPELIGLPPAAAPLHNQSAEMVRSALLFERGVVTITLPHQLPARVDQPPDPG